MLPKQPSLEKLIMSLWDWILFKVEVYFQHTDSPTSHVQTHSEVTATSSPSVLQQSTGSIGKPVFMSVYLLLLLSLDI